MLPLLMTLGFGGCDAETNDVNCAQPAREHRTAVVGDVNSDGALDISDGVAVWDQRFRATTLACPAAGDITADGVLDLGDGTASWYHLYAGNTALPTLDLSACTLPSEDAPCADGLALSVAGTTSDTSFDATVSLAAGGMDVEAWSFGVTAEGCTIETATVQGTLGADVHDTPAGLRDRGFSRTDVLAGGVVTATVLGTTTDRSTGDGAVLALHGSGSCGTCTLRVVDGLQGPGEPVAAVLTIGGRSYTPTLGSVSIQLCD